MRVNSHEWLGAEFFDSPVEDRKRKLVGAAGLEPVTSLLRRDSSLFQTCLCSHKLRYVRIRLEQAVSARFKLDYFRLARNPRAIRLIRAGFGTVG